MNNNQGEYVKRWLGPVLQRVVREARVTVLTGARQVGKSTLLRHELGPDWAFFSLDDLDVQAQAQRTPELLLDAARHVVLDEAHVIPSLFPMVKQIVDRDRSRRFILSGSANLLLLSRTTESLAGRAEFLHLLPLARREQQGLPPVAWLEQALEGRIAFDSIAAAGEVPASLVWQGGMPEGLYRETEESVVRWRDGYLRSYLERDLRQLSQIENLPDFKRLMSLAALRCGRLLNRSELARDAGLSQPTAHRYLNLLVVSEQCMLLTSFHANATTSLVKSPRIMWNDTGIAAFCAGFLSSADLAKSREWGPLLECYVYNQLRAICGVWPMPGEMFFWRTRAGAEVDFVIRRGRRLLGIEVKAGTRVRFEDTVGLQQFRKLHPDCSVGIVLYGGDRVEMIAEGLVAVPLRCLLG